MPVKERRLNAAVALSQSVYGPIPEADMHYIEDLGVDGRDSPLAERNISASAVLGMFIKAVEQRLKPRFDATGLNERLRRDAGLNEYDVERIKAIRAPLIR